MKFSLEHAIVQFNSTLLGYWYRLYNCAEEQLDY